MAEYIEREALIAEIKENINTYWNEGSGGYYLAEDALDSVVMAPTADVVEVKHGKWVSASKKQGVNIGMKCSLCGARIKYSEYFNGNHNFCHKCGARMDGATND